MKASESATWKTAGKCRLAGILLLFSVVTAFGVPADPVVVVIDSGIDAGHAVFEGRLLRREAVESVLPEPLRPGDGKFWPGWDFADNDADPQDGTGHGTHVAGLVAKGLEAEKAQGRVVMFRTGDRQHQLAPVTAALEMVAALRRKGWDIPVVLCAFDYRTKPANGEENERFKQSIEALTSTGVMCVCAAGNSGSDIDGKGADPQFQVALRHPAMVTVAACTKDGQLLAASNYGTVSVALAAPGFAVESAAKGGGDGGIERILAGGGGRGRATGSSCDHLQRAGSESASGLALEAGSGASQLGRKGGIRRISADVGGQSESSGIKSIIIS